MNSESVARFFGKRVSSWAALGAALGVVACVDHPTAGVSDETNTETPWLETFRISGALAIPNGQIELEGATDKDATEFESLGTTRSVETPIVDPSLPEYFPWERLNTGIPERFWFAGVSSGYTARLRARFVPDDDDEMVETYLLGTPEHLNTPQVCAAFQQNPYAFGAVAAALESACRSTPSGFELTFAFLTPDYNDHCGLNNEACCEGSSPCQGSMECKANNRCGNVAAPPSSDPPGGGGGMSDDDKCEEGAIETVSSYHPSECDPSFTVTGFKKCVNGKFREPSAAHCNTGADAPPGSDCYCSIVGGVCGIGVGQPCGGTNPPNTAGICRPGAGCIPVQGEWTCHDDTRTPDPKCWKPSDVVRPPVLDPTYPPDPTCEGGTPDGFGRCCADSAKDSFGNCPTSSSGGSGGSGSGGSSGSGGA